METWMKAALTLAIAATSLYILVTDRDRARREAAMWLLGTLMGYWLR
jgi:hypothetical protein